MIPRIPRRTHIAAIAALSAAALLLAGCAGGGASGGSSSSAAPDTAKEFSVLLTTENSQVPAALKDLAAGACKAENKALPLKIDQTPSANMLQKVQLLAGQDALPVMFAPTNSLIAPGGDLEKAKQSLDIGADLKRLGVIDQVTPSAQTTIKALYGGGFPTLPFQFNIEGIFYNKKIFKDNDIAIPTTLADLTAAAKKLKAAGIQPFVASGKTGWTISRWVGALLFRELGPDAMKDIADGTAKLTDAKYVKAAQQLQDMGKAGYFGDGVTNLDYNTINSEMLNGQAAMMYMGTWFLAAVNDPTQNKVGADTIGFMPFPGVSGGKGSIDQYPANVGSPQAMSTKLTGPKVDAWVKCLAENYGNEALTKQGTFSGFAVNGKTPANLPSLTADVQKKIANTKESVLWFEALFNAKANADSSAFAAPLLTGAMSAQDFMAALQTDLDAG